MITRAKDGIFQPNRKYALATAAAPTQIPNSVRAALKEPNWVAAMTDEFAALQRNRTWTLVDRPPGAKVIAGKWVFTHKYGANGELDRYKARWVVRGDLQRAGVDFGKTFTPVVKPATIRTVLTLIASRKLLVHQLDVSNAFLHGHLQERVYCQQPAGFVDPERPDAVCLLSRSLYGLRQAPRAWFTRFMEYATSIGFKQSRSDSSLFTMHTAVGFAWSHGLMHDIITKLRSAFAIKDMGPLQFFLGIDVKRSRLASSSPKGTASTTSCSGLVWQTAKQPVHQLTRSLRHLRRKERCSPTEHSTGAWPALCNISHSHAPTSPSRFSKCACICTLPGTPTSPCSRGFYGTSREHRAWAFSCAPRRRRH
jgi:hypothetical protein